MLEKGTYEIIRHLPEENRIERSESKKTSKVLRKLYFIRHPYRGTSVKKAVKK